MSMHPFVSHVLSLFPPHEGLLPKWLLLVSIISLFNSAQTYSTLHLTRRVYSRKPELVTPLSSRTFGTWTLFSAVVRAYAAYNITNPQVYDIAVASYAIAGFHFVSEWLVFGSARLGAGLMGPLVVASTSLVWMTTQRGFYIG